MGSALSRIAEGSMGLSYLASDDVGYLHQVVVYDVGQVVRGEAVRLEEDKVLFLVLFLEGAVDGVAELGPPKGVAFEAHHVRLSVRGAPVRLG